MSFNFAASKILNQNAVGINIVVGSNDSVINI